MHNPLHTVSAGKSRPKRMVLLTALICILMMVFAMPVLAGPYDSGGGGTVDTPQVIEPVGDTVISGEATTDDDVELENNLSTTGTATVTLADKDVPEAEISTGIVNGLAENDIPLVIENEGVSLEFTGQALLTSKVTQAVATEKATVKIGAKVVTTAEKEAIMSKAGLGESTGIFEVGGKVVDLTASLNDGSTSESISSFNEPVAVTIDLSDLNLTAAQIQQLTATRMEKDADGNYVPVVLGGTYNATTKKFTFYTEKFSIYTVVRKEGLVNISMVIDSANTVLNGTGKAIDAPPTIVENRTMVPLRYVAEALGVEVEWVESTQTVVMNQGGKQLSFAIGKITPGMDVPAMIVNSRTLVPIRYISESFGAKVNWIPSTRTVQVFK